MTDERPLEHLTDDELADASFEAAAQARAAASIEAMAYREIVRRREQGKSE